MAEKKAPGRPKRTEAQKTEPLQKVEKTKAPENDLNRPEKVVEVTTEKPKGKKVVAEVANRHLHEVIIDGKTREITKIAYDTIVKDPNRTVELPIGSRLVEPNITPCKDC